MKPFRILSCFYICLSVFLDGQAPGCCVPLTPGDIAENLYAAIPEDDGAVCSACGDGNGIGNRGEIQRIPNPEGMAEHRSVCPKTEQ